MSTESYASKHPYQSLAAGATAALLGAGLLAGCRGGDTTASAARAAGEAASRSCGPTPTPATGQELPIKHIVILNNGEFAPIQSFLGNNGEQAEADAWADIKYVANDLNAQPGIMQGGHLVVGVTVDYDGRSISKRKAAAELTQLDDLAARNLGIAATGTPNETVSGPAGSGEFTLTIVAPAAQTYNCASA
jgi:hypothetical protein